MGTVIHAQFGTEREWAETKRKLTEGLVAIGGLFQDDKALMEAKAKCMLSVLRQIVEDVPTVQVTAKIPQDLSEQQAELITEAIKHAALVGIEVAITHAAQVLMASVYELCTSKLRGS